MRNPNNAPLDDLVFDCSQELFSAYGLHAEPCAKEAYPSITERFAFCGVMGFGGEQLRGSLVLAATREPLDQTNPHGQKSQRDWICELSNQLMGRIKNRLLARGVDVLLATPAGLTGENVCPAPGTLRAPQVFVAASGYICVWIDCEFATGFVLPSLPPPPSAHEPAVPEGETLLF